MSKDKSVKYDSSVFCIELRRKRQSKHEKRKADINNAKQVKPTI